jgi:curved DNA-binding protein CbpA
MAFSLLPDHFKALGIGRDADTTVIKRQHRKLVLTCHPDKIKNAEQAAEQKKLFQEVQSAYETLVDENTRAKYEAALTLQTLRKERLERKQKRAAADATTSRFRYDTNTPVAKTQQRFAVQAWLHNNISDKAALIATKTSPRPSYETFETFPDRAVYQEGFLHPGLDKRRTGRYGTVASRGSRKRDSKPHKFVQAGKYDSSDDEDWRIMPVNKKNVVYPPGSQIGESRMRPEYKRGIVYPTKGLHEARSKHIATLQSSYKNPQPSHRGKLKGISGYIGRYKVTALADTGAQNCIRKQYAEKLQLRIRELELDEPQSFVMGNGNKIEVIGAVDCNWNFASELESINTTFYVLSYCIFDVVLGGDLLRDTQTLTNKSDRLLEMEIPRNVMKSRFVGLCGTPVRCLRGTLNLVECSALPDSGAEPNLIAYTYAEAQGWLFNMYQGPENDRLLQFADGSTETVSGRLRLQWNFLTGWGPAASSGHAYYEFDVLRGCPFDVLLGCTFLDDTEAFMNHVDSMHEIVKDSPSGMSIVVWVKAKFGRGAKTEKPISPEIQERDRCKRERDAEFERLAKADANRWYRTHGVFDSTDPSKALRSTSVPTLHHKHGDISSASNSTTSSSSSRSVATGTLKSN